MDKRQVRPAQMDYDSDDDRGGDAPEFMKKRPANAQEALIQGLLGEEQARKKAKHQDGQAPPPQKKGKTFKVCGSSWVDCRKGWEETDQL